MLGGEFSVTLDETGRISLPRRLRESFEEDKVVVTKGINPCLWLYSAAKWKTFEETIIRSTNQFSARDLAFRRRILGPNQELDLDKSGRIVIPLALRDFAKLSKDCIVLGQYDYIEIWDYARYNEYFLDSEDDFMAGAEEIGKIMKEQGDGNKAYSGSLARDAGLVSS